MKSSTFRKGDRVQWRSLCGPKLFHGEIVGFYGNGTMAICTDQTGLSSRPVAVGRLEPETTVYWHTGSAA